MQSSLEFATTPSCLTIHDTSRPILWIPTVAGQTKETLSKIDSLLEQAGTDKSSLLTAQIWLKDIEKDFVGMNNVWNEWLDPDNKPVRATVQATMARPNILVEIQVTAAASGK